MIFFAGNDGTIVKTQPSHVYQGSANTNDIFLVAPFAADCAVTLAFCLPNGVHTPLVAMIPQKEIEGVFSEDGRVFSGWSYTLPSNITRYYGVVSVQFYFYSAQEGVITATGSSSFTVEKGTGAVLPETPTQTIYESILSGISALSQQLHNGSYCSRSIYAWNEVAIYGANEIVFCADAREYGAFVRSKVDDNKGNPPFSDNVINADFWEEVVDFDQISTAYMDNLKQVLEDGADLVKIHADAAAASAELAKKYAEMGIIPNTDYASFEELPTEGSTKFIYLIASPTESESDYYEEYIWVPDRKKYEYIGSTRLDLSDYAKVNGTYAQMSVGKATSAETAQKDADGTLFSEKYVTKTQFAVTDSKVSEHLSDKNNPHTVTKTQIGLSAVENVRQYSAQNPPPYPVTSVDGATGAVELSEKYQKTLTAGSNITIIDDVISATAGSDPVAVKFTEQSLSDAEKLQARTNINAQQAGNYATIDGVYPNMEVGNATLAKGLAKSKVIYGGSDRRNWNKIAEVPVSAVTNLSDYSCIMLVNGVYGTQVQSIGEKSGIIELDFRRGSDGNVDSAATALSILCGNISKDEICVVNGTDKVELYYNLSTLYNTLVITVLNESQGQSTNIDKIILVQEYPTSGSVPADPIYATVRSNASCDENGDCITEIYAKQTGSYPDMTVGACGQASEANTAVNDSKGNNISETYATKEQFVGKIASFGVYSPSAPAPILNDPEKAPTCRALYYGLPQINGTTCLGYSANTEIFAPTSEGATGQLITSNGSALSWEWVFNAITDDYANIQESATYVKYFRIPYNANRRFTIVYGRKNSSGSTALFENITFPTAAKFIVTPIVFTTYYASSNDTGQIENMYGWVRGDKVTKTGFTARSYGGKGFVWLAIGYSET